MFGRITENLLIVAVTTVALLMPQAARATVPGRNGLIAFRADTGTGDQLYVIRPDGTHQRRLTSITGVNIEQPHWSPDGRTITVEMDTSDSCFIGLFRLATRRLVVLPHRNGDICEATPSFSPDGRRIFFEAFDGRQDAIWSMRRDGTDRRVVTDCQGAGGTDPEVSPDGRMLSMACFRGDQQALFLSTITGRGLRRLTPWAWMVGTKSDWSPDSRRIMFITQNAGVNTSTIRPDGTGLVQVTRFPSSGPLAFGNTYSPDGRWIQLRLEKGTRYALYKIHPDGSGLRQVTAFSQFRPRGMA